MDIGQLASEQTLHAGEASKRRVRALAGKIIHSPSPPISTDAAGDWAFEKDFVRRG
jgi:hypothetical protein